MRRARSVPVRAGCFLGTALPPTVSLFRFWLSVSKAALVRQVGTRTRAPKMRFLGPDTEASLVRIRIAIAIAIAALGATLLSFAPEARAGVPPLPPLPLKSASPSPSPTPSGTPTPAPKPSASPSQGPPPAKPASDPASNPSYYAGLPAPTPYTGPVHFVLDTVHTARNTQHLLYLLQLLQPGRPLTQGDLARGFGHFPVLGYVWYQADFGAPRYTPYFHLHEGNDLFAVTGTPISACVDGVITKLANGNIGGISLWLAGDDGVIYYYGHMSGYMPGIGPGLRVRTGDVLGFVGDTGTAQGTYPHLHFEMHPGGGPAFDPKAVLDAWLIEAVTNAEDALQQIAELKAFSAIGAARWPSVFDLVREEASPAPAWWPVALDPSASSFGVDLAFGDIAWSLDAQRAAMSADMRDESASPVVAVDPLSSLSTKPVLDGLSAALP